MLASRGRARGFVMALTAGMVLFGVAVLGAGLLALFAGQPSRVWIVLLLCGVILTVLIGPARRRMRRQYDQIELERISAVDLGKKSS